jgi:formylglycine-generating enzyme required for sulfatase activity
MAKKAAKKPTKAAKASKAERNKGIAKRAAAKTSASAIPAAALTKPDIKKIQGLLKSKTADGVTLGLSLLESLGTTRADYEAVFTESVIKAILGGWVADSWGAVARSLVPHGAVWELFQRLAEEKYLKRPGRTTKLRDFSGLAQARAAAARPAFLAAWGQAAHPKKPCIELVEIAAGSFTMGSPKDEADREDGENQVKVRITKSFEIGRTVVTQAQWRAVMGKEPWRNSPHLRKDQCGDDFPAVYVSWDDAVLFCRTLTDLERETGRLTDRQSYRLPTEAEWEYACRAKTTTAYPFGDDVSRLGDFAWYEDNSGDTLQDVATKKPNSWGLYDMCGNVYEWCADWWDPKSTGLGRVLRGGSFCSPAADCRSASRFATYQSTRFYHYGLRVVRECSAIGH